MEVGSGIGADSGRRVGAGDSCWGRSASDVLASDLGAGLPPDFAKSRVILRVVNVCRFCSRLVPAPGWTVAPFPTRSWDPRPAFPIGTQPGNHCTDRFPQIRIRIHPLNEFPKSEFRCKLIDFLPSLALSFL